MISITLLGTAALCPLPERALTAAHLSCGGRSILFDCGEGTQTAARRWGVSLMKTDVIALTHYHGDHIFGLPGLLQTMHSLGRTKPLIITGPNALERALEPILRLTGETAFPIRLTHVPEAGLALDGLENARLTAFPTSHRVPSQGYCFTLKRQGRFLADRARALNVPVAQWKRLQRGEVVSVDGEAVFPEMVLDRPRKGLKFVFTGDTAPCQSIVDAANHADLMICDATYGEDEQAAQAAEYGHMNFAQAGRIAAEANVRELWLTHYSQMIEEPEAYLPNARAQFANAVCGVDGMKKTLVFP